MKIGIAISGGGHRASLFGLGALLYLADAAKNKNVATISSVSGGSITNAYVGQCGSYRETTKTEFRDWVRPFAQRIANGGTLWAWCGTWLFLSGLALLPAIAWHLWWIESHPVIPWVIGVGGFILWWTAFSMRSRVAAKAFGATLFSISGVEQLLSDISRAEMTHVLCATDLHAGEHVYFSGPFVYSYRFGLGNPSTMKLADAVQASAAFPIGFPPRWLPTARHDFRDGRHEASYMVLSDGGVYDNMAEQWPLELPKRKQRLGNDSDLLGTEIDELIVVNGATAMDWGSVKRLRIPGLGEFFAAKRVMDVMYDNTTTPRRRLLVDRFTSANEKGEGLQGALVMLDQTPYSVTRAFANELGPTLRKSRALAVLDLLDQQGEEYWSSLTADNRHVPTTLRALGVPTSARLLLQSYLLAMANLHVILGYPLLSMPTLDEFVRFTNCPPTPRSALTQFFGAGSFAFGTALLLSAMAASPAGHSILATICLVVGSVLLTACLTFAFGTGQSTDAE